MEMPWLEETAIWESPWQLMLKIDAECAYHAEYVCLHFVGAWGLTKQQGKMDCHGK